MGVMRNSQFKMQSGPSVGLRRRCGVDLYGPRWVIVVFAFCIWHFAFASAASAQAPNFFTGFSDPPGPPSSLKPEQLKEVTFKQRLDNQLPLDAAFKDE